MKFLYTKDNTIFGEIKYCQEIFSNYKNHFHSMLSFSIIKHGKVQIIYNTDSKLLSNENQIAVFNQNQLHCTQNINGSGYYTLYLDNDWCKTIQKELFGERQEIVPVSENIIFNADFYSLIQNIYQNNCSIDMYEKRLKSIIKSIFSLYCDTNILESQNDKKNLVNAIQSYIYKNISQKITLDDIAKNFGYDKSYLVRVFKQETGTTPQNFIINEKIHKAKEFILMDKNQNLSTLALNIGFYDQSHFNRNFKRIFATSPKLYQTQ